MPAIRWEKRDGSGLDVGFHLDHASNRLTVIHSQPAADVAKIIKQNQYRRKYVDSSAQRRSGKMWEVANIPNGIVMEWMKLYGVNAMDKEHLPAVVALCSSPEWRDAVAVTDFDFSQSPGRTTFAGPIDRANHPLASNRSYKHRGGGIIDSGAWRG